MVKEPVLRYADYEKVFHVFTDASSVSQAGALMQYDEDQKAYYAIAFCSRSMTEAERSAPAVHSEIGAVVFAMRTFKPITYGYPVILHTDHRPLVYVMSKVETEPKLARGVMELQPFDLKIQHIAGKNNVVADALSRVHIPDGETKTLEQLQDVMDFPRCLSVEVAIVRLHDAVEHISEILLREEDGSETAIDMRAEQLSDPELGPIIRLLELNEYQYRTLEQ
ncbi:hypothetical protein AAVH_29591 [Aphelenchoides avenae]|nr:hypothetical protein AAVH_29591 [Aphelenchus avenae]